MKLYALGSYPHAPNYLYGSPPEPEFYLPTSHCESVISGVLSAGDKKAVTIPWFSKCGSSHPPQLMQDLVKNVIPGPLLKSANWESEFSKPF